MIEIDRLSVREELCSILQQKYVALLGQRGAGIESFIQTLLKKKAPLVGMKFISVPLPRDTDSEEGFEGLFLSRLLTSIKHIPEETAMAQRVVQAVEHCPATYTTNSRIREALDTLGKETSATYLVVILHALAEIAEKPLRNLLSMLREYSYQRGNHGAAGNKLRFLVAGDAALWHLCYHKTPVRSPFNIAHRMLLDDLSYEELQGMDARNNMDVALRFRALTGGVPIFVEEAIGRKEDFNDLSPYFSYLQDDWNALDDESQATLKGVVEGSLHFPECKYDHKCPQIPVIDEPYDAPWQDAFWKGFLRMRFCQLAWRSPIHFEFVKRCMGVEEDSRSTMIEIDLHECTERLEKALRQDNYSRYKQEPLDEAQYLAFQTYSAELAMLLDAVRRGEKNEKLLQKVEHLAANSERDWLKELGTDALWDRDSFSRFLIEVILSRAKHSISGHFDVFLCHNDKDKPKVKEIGKQLRERGILPWLDEWELRPGFPWQRLLEQQIEQVEAAAVFIGEEGIEPWQQEELEAFLRQFINRKCPVIPVLLPDAPKEPKLPTFLSGRTWVDFRKQDPDPMKQLIWGITGNRSKI